VEACRVHLKALTIKGFKSFAEPATLELEPGITVVVGPNGSGKSNVVDAVAWVLGAQAPTAVRSQKMDDVIFAGTASRPALGRAEVSLTIDNSDGYLPIEFTELTITRTLFRSGDSEYAINGVPCRLLDITELLSDTGVGRQQHIIVSQGQIDAVLNARPEERRAIIEEAAGVLKYRKRKERAERRLASAEENLNRLQDLVREVRRQLKPLERQADAARRHDGLAAELRALRTHLAGRELRALAGRREADHRQRLALDERERHLVGELARLDAAVFDAEAELAALGGSDVGELASRAASLRERLRGQAAVLAERRRRLQHQLQAAVDEGVVASLEAEAARIAEQLAAVADQAASLVPDLAEVEAAEQQLAADHAGLAERWGDDPGPAPVGAAEVRGELAALRAAAERDVVERRRLAERADALAQRRDRLRRQLSTARDEAARAGAEVPALAAGLEAAAAAHRSTEVDLEAAVEARRRADEASASWRARADALAQALDQARSRAGADALAGADGVLGTVLDLVDIDPGWEPAVEAAAGEALRAVVVDGVDRGRRALAALDAGDLGGAVLALGPPRRAAGPPVPDGTQPVRARVRALRPGVDALLDVLLEGAVAVDGGWEEAVDLAVAHPGTVVVTRRGDRFAPTGWRVGAAGTGATGAALDEARARAGEAAEAARLAAGAVAAARAALEAAAAEHRRLEDAVRTARHDLERAAAAADRAAGELADLDDEAGRLAARRAEIDRRHADDRDRLAALEARLPSLVALEEAHLDRVRAMTEARDRLEARRRAVAALRTDLEIRTAAVEERRELLRRRRDEVEARLARLVALREAASARRVALEASLAVVGELAATVDAAGARLEGWLGQLRREQAAQSDAARRVGERLGATRRDRSAAEAELAQVRERRSRLEVAEAEVAVRLETLTDALRRELDTDPEAAMAAACPELPDGAGAEARVRDLERQLKALGPINPLALEEFEALTERHRFLDGQVEDVKAARRELQRLIRSVDDEIVGVFAAAYADVADNFVALFATLFPGGTGAVTLTEADDLLSCGVEIEAKPSGKNVKKLSLLSGGERSLTALAFLFAVFRSRPSPFYVMDEVEAALDDVNLDRFLNLLHEFRKEAQLVVVTHQKRTMEAADVLYGVTMKPGGSSKVVAERMAGRD
jgi:chromosome segregation protein